MAQKLKAKISNSGRAFKVSLFAFVAIFAGLGGYYVLNSMAATVPGMYLSPATATVASSTNFTVEIRENSGTVGVNAVQAMLTYDSTRLDVASIDTSTSDFKTVVQSSASAGNITIASGVQPPPDTCDAAGNCTPNPVVPLTGDKLVAKINFTTKTTAGVAAVNFVTGTELYQMSDSTNILGALSSSTTGGSYTVTVPDTTAPTTPTNLAAVVNPSSPTTSINLTWTASTDAVGVTGYNIYRNGSATILATVTGTSYSDTGLTPSTAYSYTVKAKDAAGNLSLVSNTATATTQAPADTTKPTVSITAPAAGLTVSGTVNITATASDNVGVVGVKFYLDPATTNGQIGAEDTTSPYGVSWDTTTLANGTHYITAIARDAANNTQTATIISVAVSNAPPADITAPTVPGGLNSSGITTTSFSLNWTASTDPAGSNGATPSGVAGYEVYRSTTSGGTYSIVGSTSTTTSNQSGLTASTTYYYKVLAKDNAGNASAQSASFSVRTADVPKPPLAGDTNGDHIVNISDLAILLQNWQKNYPAADFNNTSGIVDIGDLSILLSNFSKSN